ncbi:MAG: SH3 domain-containing protein [Clostridia bacterium]|nr:SH3 domain-containing protein [Clostridia bacterium]
MKKLAASLCACAIALGSLSGCSVNITGGLDGNSSSEPNTQPYASSAEPQAESSSNEQTTFSDAKSLYITGTNDPIGIRESDDDSAKIIGQLSLGDEVKLLSSDSVLYYCILQESTGIQGYVKKAYLTDEKAAVCKSEEFFASKQIPLYDTRKSDHKEIQKINSGDAVTVLAKTSGDYWFVNHSGSKSYGYVKCTDLSNTKPSSSSKAASSTASKAASSTAPKPASTPQATGYTTGYGNAPVNYSVYYAKVNSGYLAIRSAKSFDASNELGRMYTGATVYVVDKSTGTYWYCYQPDIGIYGYVNSSYLVTNYPGGTTNNNANNEYTVWTVSVSSGYLAIRTTAARADDTNVMGKLYSGDKVYVYSFSYVNFSDQYWYVYSPSLGMWGYVDSNYIWSN